MLKNQKLWAGIAVAVVAIILFVSPYGYHQYCQSSGPNNEGYTICNIAASFGAFITDNRDAVTALSTFAVAWFTFTLWRSTKGLLGATKQTIDLTSRNFGAEHRPWVSITAKLNQLRLEKGALYISLRYTLKNPGNSPAGGIFVSGKAVLLRSGVSIEAERDYFRRDAARKASKIREVGGGVIFPGENDRDANYEFVIDREGIEKAVAETGESRTISVLMFLGADYRFTFGEPASHCTVTAFFVGPLLVSPTDAIYPTSQFQLARFPFGDYAD
jgi:hypothetical protein